MNTIYGQDLWNSGADKLRSYGAAFFHFLRCAAILILMIVGVSGVKGQDDYSGFYYIANYTRDNSKAKGYNENDPAGNYYLCPAALYYNDNPEMPYLTTKRTNQGANSIWELRKVSGTNFYHIIHYEEGGNRKYLVHNTGPFSGKENRFRVHLEANPTLSENNNVLFTITNSSGTFKIRPNADGSDRSLNPATGNKDSYAPYGNETISSTTYATGGIIGLWKYSTGNDDAASRWYLEKAAPIIRYNSNTTIKITYPDPDASIYYSFGEESTPSEGTSYSGPFDLPSGTTTIKAIAIKDGKQSGIATYTLPFLLGSTHKYIIQSENCQFYRLIPNTSIDDNTKYVSTLNVPSSTMAWHFEYAEDFYYYIVDENGWYMYYTTTDNTNKYIYLKSSKDNDDGFKFNIEFHANGGYNIMPKGQALSIYKNNSGSNDAGLKPVMYDGTIIEDVARWDIRPYSTTNLPMWEDQPFIVSTDDETNYYNIVSISTSKPIILNNSGDVKSEEVPTSDYDERKAIWVIKKVGSDAAGLLDYYTLQNAYTGQKLYYNGNGRNYVNNVLQLGLPTAEGANEQWSHFVIVQTANNGYNIIPRPIVDNTKAINRNTTTNEGFNCINRRGGNDILGTFYDDGDGSRWTFSQVDFCMPPVFEETEGNIIITCATNGAEIHFTNDGTEPTDESTLYENGWSSTIQNRIKAIAIVKSGESVKASSAVVTLLNKPDIELKEGTSVVDEGTYTYDGIPKTPTPTKVYIGTTETETGFALASTDPYLNNTNAGTATVNVIDNDATDTWYILHASETFNIKKKEVTITADSDTKVYNGTALTKNTATATGLVDGHSLASVTVTGTQTVVGESNNVPSAAVIKKGETVVTANYNITYTNGTLKVTAKAVTITAKDAEKEYDGQPLTESGFTATALETGDTHTFTVVMTAGSTITNVGTQDNEIATVDGVAVTTGTETTVGNYKVTTAKGTLTVKKKTVTITADSGEKVYDGTPLTKNSYTNTDLLSGDVLESVTVTGTQTDAGESDNVPSAAVIKNANSEVITESYNVVYKNGKLKVTAKPVTITADSGEKEYDGTALTKNTYSHTALVEGHTITSVTITGTQTNVGTSNNVPSAAVIKKGETVVTANYNITYTNGTLKITPAAATVTADAKTKVYGDAEPTYTATVTGLKNNEAASVLTYTFSRATGENVGEYTITPAGEATQGNYTVTYATGKLTITKAAANVKADDKAKGYGDADPAFTATVTGLKNGDAASVLTYTFSRAEGENVNADGYTITPAGNAEQGNYTVTYATGKLTITPKAINDGTNPAEGIDVDITYDGGTNYTVVVKQGEKTLVKDTDYELPEGSENQYDDADGNHVITIKGKDGSNYTGSFKATYIKLTFWDTTPDQTLTSETTAAVYCATQNLKVNESFEAYYVTNLADNTLTLTKVEAGESKKNYIPADQPMILISDAATAPKGFTVKPYTSTDLVDIPAGTNLLKKSSGGESVDWAQFYIFSQGEFVLSMGGENKTMAAGKFYLENPNYSTSAPSRSIIRITAEDTTGVNSSQLSDTDSEIIDTWYTIGGQKLNNKPTRKGLYLQNGKKVVIK